MPSFKISQLSTLTSAADADFFEIVDDSETTTSDKNKQITFENIKLSLYTATRLDTDFAAYNAATTYDSANNPQFVSYQSRLYQFAKSSGTDTGTTPGTDITTWQPVSGVDFFAPPATDTEAAAKTATNRYLTPANLAASGVVDTLYTIDGSLTSNRVVTLGANNLDINLDSTGVFAIQDGGSDVFDVNASGQVNIGNSELYFGGALFASTDGSNIIIGSGANSSAIDTVVLGKNAKSTVSRGVSLGRDAGNTSGTHNAYAISVGYRANYGTANIGNSSVSIGPLGNVENIGGVGLGNAVGITADYGIGIGNGSSVSGSYGIALGNSAEVTGVNGMAIGRSASAGAYEFVIGSSNGTGKFQDFYFGNGKETGSQETNIVFSGSNIDTLQTNKASGSFTIQSGQSTGSADGGNLLFKVSDAGASGTAQNAQSTVFELGASKIGMYGVTPTTRATTGIGAATFAANTSGISDDTATWGGYTIGQVVQALQTIGVLT